MNQDMQYINANRIEFINKLIEYSNSGVIDVYYCEDGNSRPVIYVYKNNIKSLNDRYGMIFTDFKDNECMKHIIYDDPLKIKSNGEIPASDFAVSATYTRLVEWLNSIAK